MPVYGDGLITLSGKAKGFSFKGNRGKKFKLCFKDEYINRIFKGINNFKVYN